MHFIIEIAADIPVDIPTIVGIAVGIAVFTAIVAIFGIVLYKKRAKQAKKARRVTHFSVADMKEFK